jgi:hypothetical protein
MKSLMRKPSRSLLRIIGINYILYAFLYDFMHNPLHGGVRGLVLYLPFAVMAIVAPLLRLAAWGIQSDFLRTRTGVAAHKLFNVLR